jgi:hypothetical protein
MTHLLLLIHAAITWALTGLIWTIQVVHYPLLAQVGREEYRAYHARHMWLITWVAGPLMLAEAGSAVLLLWLREWTAFFLVSLPPLLMIWASTLVHQVPIHDHLTNGYDESAIRRLVRTNWLRTIGWSVRALLVLLLLMTRA